MNKEFIDETEKCLLQENGIAEEEYERLAAMIGSTAELSENLPLIAEKIKAYSDNADSCDKKSKMYKENKNTWDSKVEQLNKLVMKIMDKLQTKKITADGSSANITTRTVQEIDEKGLLDIYGVLLDQIQQQFPSFIKIKASVDKNELKSYLIKDNSLMINHPELVHTKDSYSIKIKYAN